MVDEIEIITGGVSIIALVISVTKDFVLPAIFKPNIVLNAENDEECIHEVAVYPQKDIEKMRDTLRKGKKVGEFDPTHRTKQRWLRLRLKNESGFCSRTAENCYAKLLEMRDSKNQKVTPFNSFILQRTGGILVSNIAKGEYQMIDLAYETEIERVLMPISPPPFGLPNTLIERKTEKLGPDVYSFTIGVYGENFEPIFKTFKVRLTNKFGELNFVE